MVDILKYYESFFLSCGTVRYAVKDAVIILGTILKCYYQMKARKPYFPAEAVRRLSYLIVCVFNHVVWLIETKLLSTIHFPVVLIILQYKIGCKYILEKRKFVLPVVSTRAKCPTNKYFQEKYDFF